MGVKHLQGTPCQAERVHRADGDDRRYKGRCKFYSYSDGFCSVRKVKCIGSAHCDDYKEISDEDFKAKQSKQQKKNGEDECYWY